MVESSVSVSQSKKAKARWASVPKAKRVKEARLRIRQRWDLEKEDEQAAQEFFTTVDLDKAMEAHQKIRKLYENSGRILDERLQKQRTSEICTNCGFQFSKAQPWYNRETVKDPATGGIYNKFACSQACLIAMKSPAAANHKAAAKASAPFPPPAGR